MGRPHNPPRHWSVNEARFLQQNYGVLPRSEIARQLGRTVPGIESAARYQGISAIENRRAAGLMAYQRPPKLRHLSPARHAQDCLRRYHEKMKDPAYREYRRQYKREYKARVRAQMKQELAALRLESGREAA